MGSAVKKRLRNGGSPIPERRLGARHDVHSVLEKRRFVVLKSALEDFEGSSLGAVPGLLGKLYYVAMLHDGHGAYSHWGLARVHGQEAAHARCGGRTGFYLLKC